jgi:FkbH-like protein
VNPHDSDGENYLPKIAIAATFVAEPLKQSLLFWTRELEFKEEVVFAPYNQVFQELLDPTSLLARNRGGINVILARLEDWQGGKPADEIGDYRQIEHTVRDLLKALRSAVERSPASYLICMCPSSPSQLDDHERASSFEDMEALIVAELTEVSGVHALASSDLAAVYPVTKYYDPYTDKLAHIPFTPVFFTALGTMIARKSYALKSAPYKVIAVDCDQTLWSGICGEDGPAGVQIDPPRKALQQFLLRQQAAGMLLCLCSKNNEEDVFEVFARGPDMPLRLDHIVSRRINWSPKSENLMALAKELQLGLDSFIVIDDDPVECAEVQARCPEVLVLQLPGDAQIIPRFLEHVWAFDHVKSTVEDRQRTALYRQNATREQFRAESLTFAEFLDGLGLETQISALEPHQLPRVAELTHRTNQFNLTTMRRSETQLDALCRASKSGCLVVQVRDRFGDYGLVGAIIFQVGAQAITVDTFLLSCRALGRGVEHRMLARLGEIAKERGLGLVQLPLVSTPKNRPIQRFLDGIGAEFKEPVPNGFLFRFPAEFAAAVSFVADPTGNGAVETESDTVANDGYTNRAQATAQLLSSIAAELYDAERIHKWALAQTQTRPQLKTEFVEPRTSLERQLVEMYADVLGLDQVGVNDSFFELGGHSLLATQLLSRLRQEFHVDLSPRLLYTVKFTVADLAEAVIKQQASDVGAKEIGQILNDIDKLSDDEVLALLGKQGSDSH